MKIYKIQPLNDQSLRTLYSRKMDSINNTELSTEINEEWSRINKTLWKTVYEALGCQRSQRKRKLHWTKEMAVQRK